MLLKAVAFAVLALIIAAPASAGTMTYRYGVERFEPAGDLRASARLRPILHQPSGPTQEAPVASRSAESG
jgi:hypothetical protein